jgi:sigma-B regulation protein RsbU (phosphoserine phosphatase)
MNETVFGIAEEQNDNQLRETGRDMIKGGTGFVFFKHIFSHKQCWMVYAPLRSSGWSLGVLFPQDELMADVTKLNRAVLIIGITGFVFLLVIIVWIANSITRPIRILDDMTQHIAGGDLNFEVPVIKSKDEIGRFAESFMYMRDSLKKHIKELTETTAAKKKIESELKIAHDIQMSIVPKTFPVKNEFNIYAVLEPAREVGGDFYDFFFIDEDRFCFVIGDVSDKGVPAALFMAVTKTLIKNIAKGFVYPDEAMMRANNEIAFDNESSMFVTVFCGILNIKTGELWYTNAGHNPPLLMCKEPSPEFLKNVSGPAIGVLADVTYTKEKIVLSHGDTLFMYTDGVTEAVNKNMDMFSEGRLKDEVYRNHNEPVKEVTSRLLSVIKSFSAGMDQSDDITIMVLRYMKR